VAGLRSTPQNKESGITGGIGAFFTESIPSSSSEVGEEEGCETEWEEEAECEVAT